MLSRVLGSRGGCRSVGAGPLLAAPPQKKLAYSPFIRL